MRRMCLFATLQGVAHGTQGLTDRFEIFCGEECSFFEMVQKALDRVSTESLKLNSNLL